MYLNKGYQNLVMQLCHAVPRKVWETAHGIKQARGDSSSSTAAGPEYL